MTSQPDSRRPNDKKRNPRTALDPLLAGALASVDTGPSRMEIVGRAILAPFSHRRNESNSILADRAHYYVIPH
jgi:division protein 1